MQNCSGFSPALERHSSLSAQRRRAQRRSVVLLRNPFLIPCAFAEARVVSWEAESLRAFLMSYRWRCLHFYYWRDPRREGTSSVDAQAGRWGIPVSGMHQFLVRFCFPFNFFIAGRFCFLFYQIGLLKNGGEFFPTVTLILPAVTSQPNLIYGCWMSALTCKRHTERVRVEIPDEQCGIFMLN